MSERNPIDHWLTPECPSWCPQNGAHPYDYGAVFLHCDDDTDFEPEIGSRSEPYRRLHTLDLADLTGWGGMRLRLRLFESTADPASGASTLHPATVDLDSPHSIAELGNDRPASIDLRLMAALLTTVADRLDADPTMPKGVRS